MNLPEFTPTSARRRQRNRNKLAKNPLLWVLLAAFLLTALVTAYLTFAVVRHLFLDTSEPAPAAAGPALAVEDRTPEPETFDLNQLSPLDNEGGPTPQPWDGKSRVTVLAMGLDYGDWSEERQGASRTDSMLLFTIDAESQTAGMLSIPRDLWVDIPGFGYGKINTAHFLGEIYNLDGSGPGLSMRTVEQLLDIDIHYYAVIDFTSFEIFIDEIGGVAVEVPYDLSVDPIGPGNTVDLEAGMQTLDGPTALAYARNRDTIGSDFDRSARQQQVILGIRNQVLNLELLPDLIKKSPLLYKQIASGIRTNLSLQDIIGIAWLAKQIPAESIRHAVIGPDQVSMTYSPEGMDILLPDIEAMLWLRDQIFSTTGPAMPAAVATASDQPTVAAVEPPVITFEDLQELFPAENARVEVLNATTTAGLAAETSIYLQSLGINVTDAGNAEEAANQTILIDYSGKPYTSQYLIQELNIQPNRIYNRYDPNSQIDITLILGSDWEENFPIP